METYADAFSFLKLHTEAIELVDPAGEGRVLLAPDLAGRVMTSTAAGIGGASLGWINRAAFLSPRDPHFTNFGAEERLWLGPEGGQYSLYFAPGVPFDFEHWFVPRQFNEEPFALLDASETAAGMCKAMALANWSGTRFDLMVERTCRIIPRNRMASVLGVAVPAKLQAVAYETENVLTNQSKEPLMRTTGLVSLWMLGMLNASERTAILIPFRTDAEGGSGPIVNDDYFGRIPADRLAVADRSIAFRGDARLRSKIGVGPGRSTDRLGSLDLENGILTVVLFSFEGDRDYVNSAWKLQDDPYGGDVINSYNDGPQPGAEKGFGAFYELESSSPARELAAGAKLVHTQKTFHFQGTAAALDKLAQKILGAGAKEAEAALDG